MVNTGVLVVGFFSATTLLMIVISLMMYITSRERRVFHMLCTWLATCFNGIFSFLTVESSENLIGLAGMSLTLVSWPLMKAMEDAAQRPLIPKDYYWLVPVAVGLGIILAFVPGVPFAIYTGIPIWSCDMFMLVVLWKCVTLTPKERRSPLHYFFYFSVLTVIIHQMDFPIIRPMPGAEAFGFGIATIYVMLMAAVMPGMIVLDLQTEKSKILEMVLKERNIQLEKQSKMSSLGEMTASLVHELSNPLSLLLTRNALLMRHIEKGQLTPENLKNGLIQMDSTIHRMMKITQSLRSFSRDSEGDAKRQVKLQSIIDETLSFANERFIMGNTPLMVGPVPNVSLECRSVQISQILINLLNNAFDAVNGLQNPWVRLDFEVTETMLRILVSDSGKGVPDAIKARIMEPFFTTKEIGKGTGLGLSISKGITEEHGGRLYLDADLLNTCFILELPLNK